MFKRIFYTLSLFLLVVTAIQPVSAFASSGSGQVKLYGTIEQLPVGSTASFNSSTTCGYTERVFSAIGRISSQISYPNGIQLFTFTDDQGVEIRVAVKQFPGMMYFWYIENENDLAAVLASPDILNLKPIRSDIVTTNGRFNLPKGGWIRWGNGTITIYISHDLAATWVAGATVVTLICGLLSLIPYGSLSGALCAFVFGLTAATIAFYDDYGDPGFYIKTTNQPRRIWVVP
jgi:hypothetical protein